MTCMEVIGAHVVWKQRLTALTGGKNMAEAEKLPQGDYSRLSEKPKHRLIGLPPQVRSATDGIPRF